MILLLRSCDDGENDRYVRACAERGWAARCAPVLRFSFPNQATLRERLARPQDYAGLVATSPRAVRALGEAVKEVGVRDAWAAHPAYAVGPKTATAFRQAGLTPRGADTGSAAALVERIRTEWEGGGGRPLLFLSGSRRRDVLPDGLAEVGIPMEEVTVYRTELCTDWTPPEGVDLGRGVWLVFFSPSGVEALQASGVEVPRAKCAAIGPTTAAALRSAGWPADAVAETPSPEGVAEAIEKREGERIG